MVGATKQRIVEVAQEIFGQRPSWLTFFREILGVEGLVRKTFTTPAELAEFQASPQFAELQAMLRALRAADADPSNGYPPGGPGEPTRVITVRLPKSLHQALKAEAHEQHSSLNQLAITKLLVPGSVLS